MIDDAELLRQFAEAGSEEAFRQLVERHLGMVYNSANRQLGEYSHLAHDVTQTVFILLAEKAPSLLRHTSVVGWLYATTRYKVFKVLEAERRRRAREQVVFAMQAPQDDAAARRDWDRIRPVLDDALLALSEKDRVALLLRFFEGQAFSEIGTQLLLTEKAAGRRVARALEKLRSRLSRRGITSSAAALEAALGAHAGAVPPTGLAVTVAGRALVTAGARAAAYSGKLGVSAYLGSGASAVGLAGLLAVAAAVSTAGAWLAAHEHRVNQAAQVRLADAYRDIDAKTAQLAALKEGSRRAEKTVATLLANASAVAGKGSDPAPDPLAEGRRFLKAFPQAGPCSCS
jgi:RNA polymerase sigma factor (sigma-70 family)